MSVNDSDLELLQAYLDGEMPMSECEGLWRRLAVEQELSRELDQMRAEVATRTVVWSSLEPDDAAVASLEKNVLRAARRQDLQVRANRWFRTVAAVAACLLFGFGFGWWGRDKYPNLNIERAISTDTQPGAVQHGGFDLGPSAPTGKYVVNVRDVTGKIIASQQFNTYDEAKQFADDFAKMQQTRGESHDSPVTPAPSEKF
jgi:hypothetical protein